jgi:tRNA threonylcarbamoyladenosine biosynthesis protein TsaE
LIIARGKGEALASLPDEEATSALGGLLAEGLPGSAPSQNVLLDGPLGAGKTTLVRGLVASLPGGEKAQVSSPSFNIVNYYPTRPECAHFDLYRLEGFPADESLMEAVSAGDMLVVVEWSGRLGSGSLPEHRLTLTWTKTSGVREVELQATGAPAERYLENVVALARAGSEGREGAART